MRLLVVDPAVAGEDRISRSERVWEYLNELDETTLAELSMLTVVTPDERMTDINAIEFDDPRRSALL